MGISNGDRKILFPDFFRENQVSVLPQENSLGVSATFEQFESPA